MSCKWIWLVRQGRRKMSLVRVLVGGGVLVMLEGVRGHLVE